MAELTVRNGEGSQIYELHDGVPLFVGRVSECDICLPSPAVSRRHAVFLARSDEIGVKDMGSSNGTYLNDKRISRAMRLRDGDVLKIASFRIEFRLVREDIATDKTNDAARHTTVFATPPRPPKTSGRPHHVSDYKRTVPSPAPEPPDGPVPAAPPAPLPSSTAAAPAESKREMLLDAAMKKEALSFVEDYLPDDVVAKPVAPARPEPPKFGIRPPDAGNEEFGDGRDDAAFLVDEEEQEDGEKGEGALTKAAAEAGIVGEFAPDLEEAGETGPGTAPAATFSYEPNPDALPLDGEFREAIEARLFLYSFLDSMREERARFAADKPNLPEAVKSELARQDREIDKIPNPEQAENMIEKRRARQADLMARVQEAKAKGEKPPPKPSRAMRDAEEMAISQWTMCVQSGREALPAVLRIGLSRVADEPLAGVLEQSGINPAELMGGGAYYLALETFLEEAKACRQEVKAKLAAASVPGEKKGAGRAGGMLGFFGKSGAAEADEDEKGPAEGESYGELVEIDNHLAARAVWINQELAFMEKRLIQEFWTVYNRLALAFVPRAPDMPLAVRAFLRHGVIGFKKWWMSGEIRDFIVGDCTGDVVRSMAVSRKITNILYPDEYLAAVMNNECTPALDENLEINERNSPAWKADKALRRLIKSRSEAALLEELLDTLAERVNRLGVEAAGIEDRLAKLLPGAKGYKQEKNELGQQRQALRVEVSKLTALSEKIRNESLAALRETAAEVEERFRSGEIPRPTPEFLIDRECGALHKIGRLLANLKERFVPLIIRDKYQVGTDAVNDRKSIAGELAAMEGRDPAIFLETLVASKKKANRVDIRISPVIVLIPSAGVLAYSWNPRAGSEDGRLAVPTCFIRRRIRERQLTYLLADFRWDTSKAAAGMDVMTSETIVAAFMTVRWDWRKRSREGREKGLIFNEQNDRTNWRRVYEAYIQTALEGGKKLYNRNYDFYERVIGKYFDMPDGVDLLRK